MSVLTFSYSQDYNPPMPVVSIELGAPGRVPLGQLLYALVDSGSDGTLIPIDLLEKAGARYVGEARLRVITGASQLADVYLANIRVGPHMVRGARVVAAPEQSEIILGRNVINHLIITLNGPASTIEIPA